MMTKAHRTFRPIIFTALAAGVAAAIASLVWFNAYAAAGRLLTVDPNAIPADRPAMRRAVTAGQAVYSRQCASCHAAGGQGSVALSTPALNDGDWLYGDGTPAEIERTVSYGIRSHHARSWHLTEMPGYIQATASGTHQIIPLTPSDIRDLTEYLMKLQGEPGDEQAAARGQTLFHISAGCWDCHARDAGGDRATGVPSLTDKIWLYGKGDRQSIFDSIAFGHAGVCPAWIDVLTPVEIRQVALYVYALSHPEDSGESK